ncbi:hypothetical protein [Methanosarcina sp.]|uniref:hypothetical protein n=1 Tax=Methanosarcina sp. TaxID=2213 RepID=UPI002988CD15|nr:hypothetical protein [Methanosarcina sp.]MDW5552252.1 hypothetical protein [Methanosarcina sp.]MDW5556003.1 hypothetical protein [Methanosarcina sp.]MDW5561526.1 hypothetical protein [Methanosarcina sp.]
MGTENLQIFNKIEPSSCFIKDRLIQIIGFSALLLWLAVYAIKVINFSEYADGSSLDVGSLIKSLLFLASFSFTLSIFLGIWIHYKTKNSSSDNQSKWIIKLIKWFTLGLLVLMMPIPLKLFPESDKLFAIFSIVLLFAVKYVRDKMLKKIGT